MNHFEINKLKAVNRFVVFSEEHTQETTIIPHYSDYFQKIKASRDRIESLLMLTESNAKGVIQEKHLQKEALTDFSMNVAFRVRAYAVHNRLTELEKKVSYVRSIYIRANDTYFVDICRVISAEAKTEINNLADFGVTQPMLDDFNNLINKYAVYITSPRIKVVENRENRVQIRELLKQCDSELKKLDKIVAMISIVSPDMYNMYMGMRETEHTPGGRKHGIKTGIEGVISDFETDEAITGAEVRADSSNEHAVTDKKGYYELELPEGETTLHIMKTGYPAYTEDVEIEKGVVMENDIELERSEESVEAGSDVISNPA